jgi:hypothetical protein
MVSFHGLRWAGLYMPVPDSICSYQIDFDAKLESISNPAPGQGWGYGFGVCDTVSDVGPSGPSLQYAIYSDPTKGLQGFLPRVILPDANTYANDATANMPKGGFGFDWNHWTIKVSNNYGEVYFQYDTRVDGFPLSQTRPDLPSSCARSGLFLRVWGGSAQIRNIRMTVQSS